MNFEELTIQNTNLFSNSFTYLFNKIGGCMSFEDIYFTNLSKITLQDNFSFRSTVGIKIIDTYILENYNNIISNMLKLVIF